jgi:hypothetical protein
VTGATVSQPPDPIPTVYFGGSSVPALEVAAKHVDVYLTWGEPPAAVAEKIAAVRERAARHGRPLRFGIRLHVITRDRAEDAWAEAERMLDTLSADEIRTAQTSLSQGESVGQQRMLALHGGRTDRLEVSRNLWAGVGLVRPGAGTTLVGSAPITTTADKAKYEGVFNATFILGVNAKSSKKGAALAWLKHLSDRAVAGGYANGTAQHVTVKGVQYTNADLKAFAPWLTKKTLLAPRFQFNNLDVRGAVENAAIQVVGGTAPDKAAEPE